MALNTQLRITIIAESRQALKALKSVELAVTRLGTQANASNKRVAQSAAATAASINKQAQAVSAASAKTTTSLGKTAAAAEKTNGAIRRLSSSMAGLTKPLKGMNLSKHLGAIARLPNAMMRWGKSMQWVGRVMETRITFPLVALTGFAAYFGMQFEKTMTRVRKVYGDTSTSSQQVAKDMKFIERGVLAVSDAYGINSIEAGEMTAAWAQAGVEGTALLDLVKLTSEVSLLGDLDLMETQQGLLTVMRTWGYGIDELVEAMAILNIVENETAVGLGGLITVIQKAGNTARINGVAFEELAGYAAALIPVAGTPAEIGNMLKSAIPRIMDPTRQAGEVFAAIGVQFETFSWRSKTFAERIEILSNKFINLSDAERSVFQKRVGQLRQGDKLVRLMLDHASANGEIARVLEITGDKTQSLTTYQKELQTLLVSSPQRMVIAWNQIKNSMIRAVAPLLPTIAAVAGEVARLFRSFNSLSDATKKNVLMGALFLAVIGPIIGYIGTFTQLIASMAGLFVGSFKLINASLKGLKFLIKDVVAVSKFMWGIVAPIFKGLGILFGAVATKAGLMWLAIGAGAIIAVVLIAKNVDKLPAPIANVLTGVGEMFTKLWEGVLETTGKAMGLLPRAVANAMLAIGRVIKRAVIAIREWLSYLNPFAKHSPSLVDQVQKGAKVMANEFQGLAESLGLGSKVPILGMFSPHVQSPALAAGGTIPTSKVGSGMKVNRVRAIVGEGSNYPEYVIPTDPKHRSRATQLAIAAGKGVGLFAEGGILPRLRAALADVRSRSQAKDRSEKMNIAIELGVDAATVGEALDQLYALDAVLEDLQIRIDAQQSVVDGWKKELDAASDSVKAAEDVLNDLKDTVRDLESQLSESKSRMDDWLDAPLEGTYAFQDALHDNSMAQKSAQLELLRLEATFADTGWTIQEVRDWLEDNSSAMDGAQDSANGLSDSFDATGMSVDDIKRKIQLLSGEITGLRADENDLRLAGAGSDVLAGIRSQISDAEAARKALAESVGPGGSNAPPADLIAAIDSVDEFESRLEDLRRQGQIVDLEQALALEPLKYAIEETQRVVEQSFSAIMQGIADEAAITADLEQALSSANDAMDAQQSVVDDLIAVRGILQATYDAELTKLTALKDEYSATSDEASKLREQIDLLVSAHSDLISASGGGAGGGGLGVPADFMEDLGQIEPPDTQEFTNDWMEQFERDLQRELDGGVKVSFSRMWEDIKQSLLVELENVKQYWLNEWENVKRFWGNELENTKDWWANKISSVWEGLSGIIPREPPGGGIFGAPPLKGDISLPSISIPEMPKALLGDVGTILKGLLLDFGLDLPGIWGSIERAFGQVQKKLGPLIDAFKELWGELKVLGGVLKEQFNEFKPLLKYIGAAAALITGGLVVALGVLVAGFVKVVTTIARLAIPIFGVLLGSVLDFVTGVVKVFTGFIQIFTGIISGDWRKIWDGFLSIVDGTLQALNAPFQALAQIFLTTLNSVWGIVRDIGLKIYDAFQWLNPFAEHSPSLVSQIQAFPAVVFAAFTSIVTWLAGLPAKLLSSLLGMATLFTGKGLALITGMLNGVKTGWTTLWTWLTGLPGRIKTAVVGIGTALAQKGTQLITGFYAAILVKYTEVKNWFLGLPQKIRDAIPNPLLLLKQTGRNILAGLWNGIDNKWDWVRSKIVGLASKIKNAINGVFGIGSPSKEMMKTGQFLTEGLTLGMAKGYPDVTKQMTKMMSPLTSPGQFSATRNEILNPAAVSPRTYIINGDLSFPNMTDGSSVESFVDELELLGV